MKKIPNYKGRSIISGSLNDFKNNNHFNLFKDIAKQGDIVRFNIGIEKAFFLSNPKYIKYVLQENYKNYQKDYFYKDLSLALGKGLVTNEGEFWRQQRKLVQPTFHKKNIDNFAKIIRQETLYTIEKWKNFNNNRINIVEEMKELTLSIISKCLFSAEIREDAKNLGWVINELIEYLNYRAEILIKIPGRPIFPTSKHLKFKKNYKIVIEALSRIIDKKRKELKEPNDLLDMLIMAQDEETGLGMSNQQLIDEVITLFLAGHETTAHSIIWCFYLLNKYPEVKNTLLKHLSQLNNTKNLTMNEIIQFSYTDRLIKETMRFFPVVWGIGREAIIEDEIDGYIIPKSKAILIPILYMHYHPEYWDDPDTFNPDRFLNIDLNKEKKWVYMPFGEGPRKCVGNNFAIIEMQIILTLLLKEFNVNIEELDKIKTHNGVTTRPQQDLYAIVKQVNS